MSAAVVEIVDDKSRLSPQRKVCHKSVYSFVKCFIYKCCDFLAHEFYLSRVRLVV